MAFLGIYIYIYIGTWTVEVHTRTPGVFQNSLLALCISFCILLSPVNTNLSSLGKILYEDGFLLDSEVTVSDDRNSIIEKFPINIRIKNVIGVVEKNQTKKSISHSKI